LPSKPNNGRNTGCKNAEEENAYLASFPSLNPDPIIEINYKGHVLYSNESAKKLFPDLNIRGLSHPFLHWVESAVEDFKQQKNETVTYEVKASEHWYYQRVFPMPNKQVIRIYAYNIDLRKKAEEALRESEQLYKSLFENTDKGFQLVGILFDEAGNPYDFRFLQVNKAYEGQTGLKVSKIIGKTAKESLPGIEPFWISTYGNVAKTGKAVSFQQYNQNTNRWYDVYAFLYGKSQVAALFSDITERKKTEEALKESEERFRVMADGIPAMLWVVDPNGKNQWVNKYFKKYFHVDFDQVAQEKWEALIHPDDLKKYKDDFFVALRKRKPFYAQVRQKDANGEWRWVESYAMPRISASGEMLGYVGLSIDISDRKKTQDLATIGMTAGMVGHDIRNPLQSITGELYLLNDTLASLPDSNQKNEMKESLDSITENIFYINKIVQDLQDYARPVSPEYSTVGLSNVLPKIFENVAVPQSIKLSLKITDLDKLRTDPMLLQRALSNLITNAIQAMPKGGILEITGHPEDNKAIITVSDTGVGIPNDVKPKLFTPMTTTKAKGQGFGLAVSKRLIEAMKGTLSFESEEGKGTKFIIELPS
jgi:PAS domain S-box-containing protein